MRNKIADFAGKDSGDIKRRILKALGEGKIDYLNEE
jgi:hypothetical protein